VAKVAILPQKLLFSRAPLIFLLGQQIGGRCCKKSFKYDKQALNEEIPNQGCQSFLDTIYQCGAKYTTLPPNGHKMYRMAVIYSK
jgi:hypothetical protein